MSAFPRKRKNGTYGAVAVHSKASKEWEAVVREQLSGLSMIEGPVKVIMTFWLPRPRTVDREVPSVPPDIDKIVRAVLDPMTGIIIEDDARVVDLVASKRYETEAEPPGVEIVVQPVR
jgi:Holliday junction resolvase RusA-like endonuclease